MADELKAIDTHILLIIKSWLWSADPSLQSLREMVEAELATRKSEMPDIPDIDDLPYEERLAIYEANQNVDPYDYMAQEAEHILEMEVEDDTNS